MRRLPLWALAALLATMFFGRVTTVRADGMPMPKVTAASTEVRATAQRAVVWLRNGTWEVHIQPVFQRDQGEAAWVVPWPARPTIHESNATLFDELELVTSPVFVDYCTPPDEGGGACMAADMKGSNGSADLTTAEDGVTVWEKGTVGQLDYLILSASDGDDLVDWLQTHDFMVTSAVSDAITEFETEDQFFFVATLSADADPALPHVPVRFVLPDLTQGFYPLRLTSLAVPTGALFDLTLWVVTPSSYSSVYVPQHHGYEVFDSDARDRDAFETDLTAFFDEQGADTLAVLFNQSTSSYLLDAERCSWDGPGYACVSYEDLGLPTPQGWSAELMEISNTFNGRLQRYQARMDAEAMATDLVFLESGGYLPEKSPFYWHYTGQCPSEDDEYVGCSVGRPLRTTSWFLLTALILILLGLGAFRRFR